MLMVESDLLWPLKVKNWGNSLLRTAIFPVFSFYSFTAPQSVPTPSRVRSINGYSMEVTWDEPVVVRGVIEKYVLRAYSEDAPHSPRMPSVSSELVNTSTLTGKGASLRSRFFNILL